MFSQWFLTAWRDVISGLRIRNQIKHNQRHCWIGTQKWKGHCDDNYDDDDRKQIKHSIRQCCDETCDATNSFCIAECTRGLYFAFTSHEANQNQSDYWCIHDQIKTNQTIWFEHSAFLIMLMMIVMMMRMMQATSSQANQTWHPTMWWRNQPHNTFILHCELRARTTLCICMLQQTHPLQMAFLYFVS